MQIFILIWKHGGVPRTQRLNWREEEETRSKFVRDTRGTETKLVISRRGYCAFSPCGRHLAASPPRPIALLRVAVAISGNKRREEALRGPDNLPLLPVRMLIRLLSLRTPHTHSIHTTHTDTHTWDKRSFVRGHFKLETLWRKETFRSFPPLSFRRLKLIRLVFVLRLSLSFHLSSFLSFLHPTLSNFLLFRFLLWLFQHFFLLSFIIFCTAIT